MDALPDDLPPDAEALTGLTCPDCSGNIIVRSQHGHVYFVCRVGHFYSVPEFVVGTEDGLAKYPYVRESRRIRAELTVAEQHVSTADRMRLGKVSRPEDARAEAFADSVGIGSYAIDLHPSSAGDNYIDFDARPFQIPLGAMIPRRVENLLPACKNLGTTHITNGCYRLHPVEWSIGEAAGALVAFARAARTTVRAVRSTPRLLADFQRDLRADGVLLEWPDA